MLGEKAYARQSVEIDVLRPQRCAMTLRGGIPGEPGVAPRSKRRATCELRRQSADHRHDFYGARNRANCTPEQSL